MREFSKFQLSYFSTIYLKRQWAETGKGISLKGCSSCYKIARTYQGSSAIRTVIWAFEALAPLPLTAAMARPLRPSHGTASASFPWVIMSGSFANRTGSKTSHAILARQLPGNLEIMISILWRGSGDASSSLTSLHPLAHSRLLGAIAVVLQTCFLKPLMNHHLSFETVYTQYPDANHRWKHEDSC